MGVQVASKIVLYKAETLLDFKERVHQ